MKNMKTNLFFATAIIFLLGLLFTSCEQSWDKSSLDLDRDVSMKAFSVEGVEGSINDELGTITVNLPRNAEENGLTPNIEVSEGASITPEVNTPVNFSNSDKNPVKFRVVNGNVYKDYRVTVKAVKASITSFSIGERNGIIDQDEQTIHVIVNEGTDITQLKPEIKFTNGAVLTPEIGEVMDFTDPVTYTLSYLGEEFQYSVVVEIGEEIIPPLIIYNGEDVVPNWWPAGSAGDVDQSENPLESSINPTQYCASIWRNGGDDPWTGGGLGGLEIDGEKYLQFELLVFKETAGDVQLEIQGEGAGNQYLKAMYSEDHVGEWQLLKFVMPENHGFTKIHTILVAPHIDDTKEDASFVGHRMYWDELTAYPAE